MVQNTTQSQYFTHIGNQLARKFVSMNLLSRGLTKLAEKNNAIYDEANEKKYQNQEEISQMDNIYLSIIEKLTHENIGFYIKNISVDVDFNYSIVGLRYDYYESHEKMTEATISINFI